jgi:hypothetical protein
MIISPEFACLICIRTNDSAAVANIRQERTLSKTSFLKLWENYVFEILPFSEISLSKLRHISDIKYEN